MKDTYNYPYQNRSLTNLPNELWREIPGFDGNYLISNNGRVKALPRLVDRSTRSYWTKEKVLASHVHIQKLANGNSIKLLRLVISYQKKKISVFIGRMVYYLFVNEFDLNDARFVVFHKDGDNLNARFENLMLTNRSDMMLRTYINGRSKQAFSNKPKKISQFDMKGNKIAAYASISMIEKETGFDAGIISVVVKRKNKLYKGYIWKSEEDL